MKKFSMIALALVVMLSFAACGRRKNNETSAPTTTASDFNNTIIPNMDPTIATNIPDPSVDTSMPMYTDGTEGTNGTDGSTSGTTNSTGN